MAGKAERRAHGQHGRPAAGDRTPRGRGSAAAARVPGLPAIGMDVVAAAVLVCTADGTIVDLNRPAADLLGIEPGRPGAGRCARSASGPGPGHSEIR